MKINQPRRAFLMRTLQLPSAGIALVGLTACSDKGSSATRTAAVCADVDRMDANERATRSALGYVEKSPNAATVCGGCSFFHPSESLAECGTCDVFSGGPANKLGHCNSWNQKG